MVGHLLMDNFVSGYECKLPLKTKFWRLEVTKQICLKTQTLKAKKQTLLALFK